MLKGISSLINAKAIIVGSALFICISQAIIDWQQICSNGEFVICACPSKGKIATFLLISSLFLFSRSVWLHLFGIYFTLVIGYGFWNYYYFFATDTCHSTLFNWNVFDKFVCEQGFLSSLAGFLSFAIFLYSVCLFVFYFCKFLLCKLFSIQKI